MDLTERVGPLPLWAWGGIVVGGVGLGLYRRHVDAASAAAAAPAVQSPSGLSGVTSTAVTDAASFDPSATTGPSSSDPYGVTTTYNIAGDYNPGQTVNDTTVGTENVTQPTQYVPLAYGGTGVPPHAAPLPAVKPPAQPTPSAPAPTTTVVKQTAPPPPPAAQHYVVKPGDTYWALAQRFYGDPLLWPTIQRANGYAPTRIPIGVTLTIPPKP